GLFVLGGRLDGQVGGPDRLQFVRRLDAGDGGFHGLVLDDPAGHLSAHVLLDLGQALGNAVGADVVQQDVVAAQRDHVSDAGTHLAGADDADRLDVNHGLSPYD